MSFNILIFGTTKFHGYRNVTGEEVQEGYRQGTGGVQEGYRRGTGRVQEGYRKGTERVLGGTQGYRSGTQRVQKEYKNRGTLCL